MLCKPGLKTFCCWWVLLGGEAAAADTDPLAMNMHVFGHVAEPPAASLAFGAVEPERILIPAGGAEGRAMEMVVFDQDGIQRADRAPTPDTEPPRPGQLGRRGSAIYGYQINAGLNLGYREDRLNWNIAAPGGTPDVLSELEWEDLQILQLQGDLDLVSPSGWRIRTELGYGWILEGENQDSDFLGDNRTLEFSRSNNEADRGHVFDVSFGTGYRFTWGGDAKRPWFALSPLAGYSYHQQNLRAHDGFQTLSKPIPRRGLITPPVGPFSGLDSKYDAEWHGPWAGLRIETSAWPIRLFSEFSYHWADYHAQADWNLRRDFLHPKSFSHHADGTGFIATAGARYLSPTGWALELNGDYQPWKTGSGQHKVFLSNGTTLGTRLNRVNWESFGGSIGFRYFF